ncbi:hypothetical protein [Microbacterium sp. HJ5]
MLQAFDVYFQQLDIGWMTTVMALLIVFGIIASVPIMVIQSPKTAN